MELYKKIYIKSEADLPKKDGFYFVNWTPGHAHHTTMAAQYYDESIKGLWFGKAWFDWYLQPIEITNADIEAEAIKRMQHEEGDIIMIVDSPYASAFIDGAKAALNNEIKHK